MNNSLHKRNTIKISRKSLLNNDPEFKEYEVNETIKRHMIRDAFQWFDGDGSGEIDRKEFRHLVTSLGIEADSKKIDELYSKIDSDKNGTIDIKEFTSMMMNSQFNKESPIDLHLENAFKQYDKDSDGYIGIQDLISSSEELGELMSLEDMDLLLNFIKMFGADSHTDENIQNKK